MAILTSTGEIDYSKVEPTSFELDRKTVAGSPVTTTLVVRDVHDRVIYRGRAVDCPRQLLEKMPELEKRIPQPFDKYVTERKTIKRLKLIGPMAERNAVADALYDAGWDIKSQGPYTDSKMFPRCDDTRFLLRAEREV